MNKRITYTQLKRLENKAKAERLDKAIEYLESYNPLPTMSQTLKILKGEEDE